MTRLTVNGRTYYVDRSGAGVPLVLLHGFTGDTSTWQPVRQVLESSYQVVAIDILGHGQSDKPDSVVDYHMEKVGSDILSLLDVLSLGKVHLLGYSMGGRLALYIAHHAPERFHTLILESASPGLATEQEREDRRLRDNALADKIEANGIEWFVNFWQGLSLWDSQKSLPEDMLNDQRKQRLRNSPKGLANSLRGMGTGVQPNLWGHLSDIMLPVQLIVGEYDKKFIDINYEMAEAISDVVMTTIPYAGHTVHLENLDGFIAQVKHFLNIQIGHTE